MLDMSQPDGAHESERQKAVDATGLARRRNVGEIDAVVDMLASTYMAPLAALSVIDRRRQILVSRVGTKLNDSVREEAFCAVAIHNPGEPLIVPDALRHPLFAGYRIVVSEPHIRFYAGMPIVSRDGYALGALCIADTKPWPNGIDTPSSSSRPARRSGCCGVEDSENGDLWRDLTRTASLDAP